MIEYFLDTSNIDQIKKYKEYNNLDRDIKNYASVQTGFHWLTKE